MVFGIGLAKTATTSLCDALSVLKYRTIHYAPISETKDGTPEFVWPWWMNKYNAMADLPVAVHYKSLDQMFPGARFILTERELSPWLNSCRKHFTITRHEAARNQSRFNNSQALNKAIYGTHVYDEALFTQAFKAHQEDVSSHFRGREDQLLRIDLTTGDDPWPVLCEFLDAPLPAQPFPHSNARPDPV